jgi:hypothetical protein
MISKIAISTLVGLRVEANIFLINKRTLTMFTAILEKAREKPGKNMNPF